VIFLLSFALFSKYIKSGGMKEADFAFTVKLQERIDKSSRLRTAEFIGDIMDGSTFFASPEFSVAAVVVMTFLAVINLKSKKIKFSGLIIPVLFGLLIFSEIYGKSVVHHPAPPFFMIKNPTSFFPKYYINEEYSYPSGHAARSIFISISLFNLVFHNLKNLLFKKKILLAIFLFSLVYIILVSISRIYLGHHWLSDIIGGLFLGLGFSIPSFFAFQSKIVGLDGGNIRPYNTKTMSA
jgi:membrane-associated phospholipid phosphatase